MLRSLPSFLTPASVCIKMEPCRAVLCLQTNAFAFVPVPGLDISYGSALSFHAFILALAYAFGLIVSLFRSTILLFSNAPTSTFRVFLNEYFQLFSFLRIVGFEQIDFDCDILCFQRLA